MTSRLSNEDLDRATVFARDAARAAGEQIKKTWLLPRGTTKVDDKSVQSIDLVTETDRQCEKLIFSMLRAEYPAFEYMGEESSSEAGGYSLSDAATWIVDPVDGTTNFVHRSPEVFVSIGLTVNKEPVLGVMYDPIRDEMYYARKGNGAFLNGEPIHVDQEANSLNTAIVGTNIGYLRDETAIAHLNGTTGNLLRGNVRGLRMLGSACYGLATVACGRTSCFYECGPHPWDVCAAAVIVREAGGVAMDMNGDPLDLCSRRYLLACNPTVANLVLKCIHHPIPL